MRVCKQCELTKELTEFHSAKGRTKRYHIWTCRDCVKVNRAGYRRPNPSRRNGVVARASEALWRARNKDHLTSYAKKWRAANTDKWRASDRRNKLKKYGITPEQFDALYAACRATCPICLRPIAESGKGRNTVAVDHCHATNTVRGLLCQPCNAGLGILGDSLDNLRRAIAYMESGGSNA